MSSREKYEKEKNEKKKKKNGRAIIGALTAMASLAYAIYSGTKNGTKNKES